MLFFDNCSSFIIQIVINIYSLEFQKDPQFSEKIVFLLLLSVTLERISNPTDMSLFLIFDLQMLMMWEVVNNNKSMNSKILYDLYPDRSEDLHSPLEEIRPIQSSELASPLNQAKDELEKNTLKRQKKKDSRWSNHESKKAVTLLKKVLFPKGKKSCRFMQLWMDFYQSEKLDKGTFIRLATLAHILRKTNFSEWKKRSKQRIISFGKQIKPEKRIKQFEELLFNSCWKSLLLIEEGKYFEALQQYLGEKFQKTYKKHQEKVLKEKINQYRICCMYLNGNEQDSELND